MNAILEVCFVVFGVLTMIVAPIAWFRGLHAKNRAAYWKNILLFVVPIGVLFLLASATGRIPEASSTPPPTPPNAKKVFDAMLLEQQALLVVAGVLWIVGGNILFQVHNRRLGKKWWQALNPLDPPFKDFNTREWLILGGLAVVSLGLVAFSISLGHAA